MTAFSSNRTRYNSCKFYPFIFYLPFYRMRLALSLAIALLTGFSVAGCGGNQPPVPSPQEAAKEPPVPPPAGAESSRHEALPK